jgi:serine/threonine protein phosphatase 1
MQAIKPTPNDKFIFLGDYVDGWPYAVETLKYLIEFKRNWNCIFLMGNHDSHWGLKGYLQSSTPGMAWLQNGGRPTLIAIDDEIIDNPSFADELLEFLGECKYSYLDDENRLFVHGGIRTTNPADTMPHDMMWDRGLWLNSLYHHDHPDQYEKKQEILDAYKEIYIGHTTVWKHSSKPLTIDNLTNMDTGAGWHGKLSAMDIDTKEVWQSRVVKRIYPDEFLDR